MSGSRVLRSGVGTQITTASARDRTEKSPVATRRRRSINGRRSASATSWTCDRPPPTPEILAGSVSMPCTGKPLRANSQASGRPTYPRPITATIAVRLRNASTSRSAASRSVRIVATSATVAGPSTSVVARGARARRRGCLATFLLATLVLLLAAALLGALLPVMADDPFAHPALLDAAHHVLEPLVHGGVVHDPAQAPLAGVDLAQDRLGVPGHPVDLLQERVGVHVVAHEASDQPLPLIQALGGPAQRGGHHPEVLDRLRPLPSRRRHRADHPLVAVGLLHERAQVAQGSIDVRLLLVRERLVGQGRPRQSLPLLHPLERAPQRREAPLEVGHPLAAELRVVDHLLDDPA